MTKDRILIRLLQTNAAVAYWYYANRVQHPAGNRATDHFRA